MKLQTKKQTPPKLAVWWLTEQDYHGFQPSHEEDPLAVPDYIWEAFCDRCGRPGRFRLWVPDEIELESLEIEGQDPRWAPLKELMKGDAGGIVIYLKDVQACLR